MRVAYYPRQLDIEQFVAIYNQVPDGMVKQHVAAALRRGDTVGIYCTPEEGWVFRFRRTTYSEEFGSPRAFPGTWDGFPLIAEYRPR